MTGAGVRGVGHDGHMQQVASGMLLVATPALQDPNFVDTVVLLLDVNEEGALGVVLNRPSSILVADVLEAWRDVVAEPEVLFRGGPVGTDGALAVARLRDPQDAPVGWRPVAGLLGMVDLDTPPELVNGSLSAMRVFAGYAGWGAGQLDGEVEEGSWYVVSSEAGDAFRGDPSRLRRDVMRRQPGMLAWHVNRPVDPDLN
jgi:putative transcriptional regulator